MNKQKSLSQLNNSSAKQKYSFNKAQRFAISKKSLPLCYNINLNIDLTKSNKFSTSKRQQPFKPKMSSPLAKYNIQSTFQININKKKGVTMGVGRNEMSNSNFSYINKNDNPGPGQYNSEKNLRGNSLTQSIGLKTNDHSIGFLNQKNLNTNPGPGKYNYKQITLKGGKMHTTANRFKISSNNVPGVGSYYKENNPYWNQSKLSSSKKTIFEKSKRTTYFDSKIKNSITPGPGKYKRSSDFE